MKEGCDLSFESLGDTDGFLGGVPLLPEKGSFFVFNRVFLLVGLAAAFIIPAIRLSYTVNIPYVMTYFYSNAPVIVDESVNKPLVAAGGFNINWLWLSLVVL